MRGDAEEELRDLGADSVGRTGQDPPARRAEAMIELLAPSASGAEHVPSFNRAAGQTQEQLEARFSDATLRGKPPLLSNNGLSKRVEVFVLLGE